MKKYLPILVLLIGLGVFITTATTPAFAATIEELQIQIQKLLEAIRSLQSQVPTTPPPSNTCPFVSVMYLGYSETPTNEVRELQKLLKQYSNIYPEGMVTGYFGKLTDAALRRFQQQYGLPTTGQTDTATRAKLCELWQNKNQIGNCGWCGTACVRQTSGMYCPQVMPPIGVSCQEVNGVCQITPLAPITTTTIPPVPTTIVSGCTDSDGGMNPYVKGTVTYQGQTYTDTCVAADTLKEYYCDNGIKQEHLSTCQNGYTCQDGACVATDTSLQVQILKPATGEVVTANAPYEIKWSLINPTSNEIQTGDRIRILFDQSGNFTNWTTVVSDLPLTQTSYLWNTPNITCYYCSLRLGVYRPSTGYWVKYAQIPIYLKQITPPVPEPIPPEPISSSSDILMDALNKLTASLMSLMELLKH